ncbi:MAG: hypothetical protein ABI587_01900 [Gemmatimonadales bacterium]
MRRIRFALLAAGIAAPLLAVSPARGPGVLSPCSFGRGTPFPDASTWSTQLTRNRGPHR